MYDAKKERKRELIDVLIGSVMFAFGVNVIIIPLGLYNGGFMGIAQLLRTGVVEGLHVPVPSGMDIAGIIYFFMNIPLFYMGYRIMGKAFVVKSLLTVGLQSGLLVLIPIPQTLVIEDCLTACIIGGIIAGTGVGLTLRGRSSGGGQDIIGVCFSKQYPNLSVGKINIAMNLCVYAVCLFLFNIEVVIYSLIYTTVLSMAIDRIHTQNINTSVMIFTKKEGISKAIMEQTGRGVTNWDGEGAYTQKRSYILFVLISQYEVNQIRQIVHNIDPDAFMIFTEGCSVDGHFEKRL